MSETVHEDVKEYYGKTVQKTEDLFANVCTVGSATFSSEAKEAMKMMHPDVLEKNYGCGAVYPEAVERCSVLDLGSGAGIDCFVLSKLVGPSGRVVGVDMTQEQIDTARKYIDYHTEKYGYSKANVEFREGYIEKLDQVGLKDGTFDIVISNCVVNLSPDKSSVLSEAFRVLKPGGEMYFSDIYCNQPVPEVLRKNKVLWGECISGALPWEELMQIATSIGFAPPILVKSIVFQSDSPKQKEILASMGPAVSTLKFCSATYRLIKPVKPVEEVDTLDSTAVQVTYKGTIKGYEKGLQFSYHGTINKNDPVMMASSTANFLHGIPRFAPHFHVSQPLKCCKSELAYPPLSDFLRINPFDVESETRLMEAPSGSCGGNTVCCSSSNVKKSCC